MYLECTRNGSGMQQMLDVRACMVCTCTLKTRKQCTDFKALSSEEVTAAEAWLDLNEHKVHMFAARLLNLEYKGADSTKENNDVKVQSMRQDTNRTRVKPQADRKKGTVRGAMLTV